MKTTEQINAITSTCAVVGPFGRTAAGAWAMSAVLGGQQGPAGDRLPRHGAAAGLAVETRPASVTDAHVPGTRAWSPPT